MSIWNPSVAIPGQDLIWFAMSPYTTFLGDWFYFIVVLLLVAMTYLKTQSYDVPIVLVMLTMLAGVVILPAGVSKIACVVIATAAAVAMVRLFKS